MPRRARLTLPNVAHHVIQRGNNRAACFYADQDYLFYLDWLKEYAQSSGCLIHAYVLMTNHVHLLVTPVHVESLAQMMKRLGQSYVQYVNRTYKRSGTLWEGRYKSCLVGENDYLLGCYRYIELNPVRAAMVEHPAEYQWTSYRANAQGEIQDVLVPHTVYQFLAPSRVGRLSAYRALFRHHLDHGLVEQIRKATNGNFALGSSPFKAEIELALGRRAQPAQAGRPKKVRVS